VPSKKELADKGQEGRAYTIKMLHAQKKKRNVSGGGWILEGRPDKGCSRGEKACTEVTAEKANELRTYARVCGKKGCGALVFI